MNTPSKELITEVLEIEKPDNITLIVGNKYNNNIKQTLFIEYNNESGPIMFNIYEFAFKCKEWAFKQGYKILSGYDVFEDTFTSYINLKLSYRNKKHYADWDYDNSFDTETELEAIFKACEWILLQIKDNK